MLANVVRAWFNSNAQATHGLRTQTPLDCPPQTPPLFLPSSPFSGFRHLGYKHYLAAEQDRAKPEFSGTMAQVDAFTLTSE